MTTLVELFNEAARSELRKRVVVCDADAEWTLGELDLLSDSLAKFFIEKYGAKKGNCIGIYMNKCAYYVLAYTAALKAGCAYLPLDISYPQTLLTEILKEISPVVICSTADHVARLPGKF
ncbi:unnamed protein product [Gongylonema pulchrum]|uniref:AMP-binding domain-containing protein n=1 Tax=Gongylonema pulchrum TaxID=637853 RepID=A0A183CYD3_9BILA|nr:unnamed protein product [Gongylonema pulchrum]